ncbi:MAG: SDR family oxidoreductase, partial [Limnohabitans sp.]|nr:SDR family oxidoreductase [Limnohabitans sp.]
MGQFNGKTVVVTGGGGGIGGAACRGFAQAGAKVAVFDMNLASAEKVAQAIRDAGGQALALACDITDRAAVDALVGSLGSLDAVVNSAGLIRRDAEHDPDVFAQVMDVNVNGGMRVSAAARPLLAKSRGAIVFIGSVMSFFGGPKQPAYSASKGAVRNLTMSLAAAYAADGIRVNAVAPGWVVTELSRGARENPER